MSIRLDTPHAQPAAGGSGVSRRLLWLVCLSQFMVILDASIINVALPSVARDLGFSSAGLGWVVNGYLLPFAGLMLVAGRAVDLLGPRSLLLAGVGLFAAASLAGGLATAPSLLVAARVVQGVGAALMAPTAIALISTEFAGAARVRALAAWSAAGGFGGTVGAVAGGAITSGLSWRWVLLINVPIGIALAWLALTAVRPRPRLRGPIDLLGATAATAGLAALVFGVMAAPGHVWTDRMVAGPVLLGFVLLVAFVLIEARSARPMMPLELFRSRSVRVGTVAMALLGGIAIAMWYFTSLALQNSLGYSPVRSGLAQTPAALMFMLTARWAGPRLTAHGPIRLLLPGCALLAAGFGWLALTGPTSAYATGVLGPTLLVGAGIGLTFPTVMAIATTGIAPGYEGIAGGLASTAQQVGAALGLALLTVAASGGVDQVAVTQAQLAQGYDRVFLIAVAFAAGIAALALALPRIAVGARQTT